MEHLKSLHSACENIQLSSVTHSCSNFCDPTDFSTTGFLVNHRLPEFALTHIHRFGDAIQPSHPLSSPYPPAFNLSPNQGLFQGVSSSVLSLLYGPTLTSVYNYWKTTALTIWTFVGKVMFLLFNMLSRLVITFLPRSNHLLISWPQSPSAVILEPQNKV